MVIDVRVVPEGHSQLSQETRLEAFAGDLPPLITPVRCDADIDRMGATIAVSLRFGGEFNLPCARCLENFPVRVEGSLRVIIKEAQGRLGPSLDDDGVDFYFDVNHELVDISSAVYDEVMTALPLKPLCSDDCAGVVYDKGDNVGESVDPRWEALKKIKI